MTQESSIRRQAIGWFVRLSSGEASEIDHVQWRQWYEANIRHQEAWARLEGLQHSLQRVPTNISLPTLQGVSQNRRSLLKGIAVLGIGSTFSYAMYREGWMAEYRTGTGEQREVRLADGSAVVLNTATAMDAHYDAHRRMLTLHEGEIVVETAKDKHIGSPRPFNVVTEHGRIHALGTRFLVHTHGDATLVAVLEHAVDIYLEHALSPTRLEAGQQTIIRHGQVTVITPVAANITAWQQGHIIAVDWRLADLVAELARYRAGWLRCDPAVAELKVSGVYPVHDTDKALLAIRQSFPVHIVRTTRYWVSIQAL
ncbi:FecR domain-containing protein [Methylobacillus gramineus]|uniref:FecR domain-containing protein n=1 Tax=Methylobacillus gramineus TaxID=755169 RepID=UPI001CFF9D81|nr:FecR domain-containing protein [Methylobacillus gramineus]MCB5185478.1 FecR domain-containing protein [Methylobacillus gramineus]